jgi:hypothetical protein
LKTFEEIINQEPVYLNNWNDKIDVISDFEDVYITKEEYEATEASYDNDEYWKEKKEKMTELLNTKYKDINILFASYGTDNYSGDAWVLFEQNGKLYEVNGGHCSCYGLEGQWEPDEVILVELEHRLLNGTFGEDDWSGNEFKEKLCEFLGVPFIKNRDKY